MMYQRLLADLPHLRVNVGIKRCGLFALGPGSGDAIYVLPPLCRPIAWGLLLVRVNLYQFFL